MIQEEGKEHMYSRCEFERKQAKRHSRIPRMVHRGGEKGNKKKMDARAKDQREVGTSEKNCIGINLPGMATKKG